MTLRYVERYRYHIIVSVPVVALLASSLSFSRDGTDLCLMGPSDRYVTVGERVTLQVVANADEPINTISGVVRVPATTLRIDAVTQNPSILDLWSNAPHTTDDGTILRFAGGTTQSGGFLGSGVVTTFDIVPVAVGEASVQFDEAHMFAHDGTGREVACGTAPVTFIVRDASRPSPDVNNDARVDIFDLGAISTRIFLAYDRAYDLNADGTIGIDDLVLALRYMRNNTSALASLALLWR